METEFEESVFKFREQLDEFQDLIKIETTNEEEMMEIFDKCSHIIVNLCYFEETCRMIYNQKLKESDETIANIMNGEIRTMCDKLKRVKKQLVLLRK